MPQTRRLVSWIREAAASLGTHKLRTSLMMLGVVIGVAALTAVVCLGQGTRERIMKVVAKHGLDMLMVRPGGTKQVFAPQSDKPMSAVTEADARAIEEHISNINLVGIVQNERGWELKAGGESIKIRVFGVSEHWEAIRRRGILLGEPITRDDVVHARDVCVLGYNTRKDLFGEENPVGRTVLLGGHPLRVKGVYVEAGVSAGGDPWDDRIILPIGTTTKKLFKRPWLEQIVIQVKDVHRIQETKKEIEALLCERHNLKPGQEWDFFVREPGDLQDAALATHTTLTNLLMAISGVAMLVGGIVIMNIMLLSVSQRIHEIGLRRAVGARRRDIAGQFFIEAMGITLLGGLLGAACGVAWALALSAWGRDVLVTWQPFALSAGACGALAFLFGIYPALKAARIDPAAALRERRTA